MIQGKHKKINRQCKWINRRERYRTYLRKAWKLLWSVGRLEDHRQAYQCSSLFKLGLLFAFFLWHFYWYMFCNISFLYCQLESNCESFSLFLGYVLFGSIYDLCWLLIHYTSAERICLVLSFDLLLWDHLSVKFWSSNINRMFLHHSAGLPMYTFQRSDIFQTSLGLSHPWLMLVFV